MPRFLTGDELGNIKALQYSSNNNTKGALRLRILYDGSNSGRTKGIQALSISSSPSGEKMVRNSPPSRRDIHDLSQRKLASAHSDGSASIFHLLNDDTVDLLHDWKETRLKSDQTYVGLSTSAQCENFLSGEEPPADVFALVDTSFLVLLMAHFDQLH